MHKGTVVASSAGPGKGSEFVVRLPVTSLPAPPKVEIEAEPEEKRVTRRILVVDDNRDSADSLVLLLRFSGSEVEAAHDGLEAVEKAEAFRPDVVLMDIGMPKLNGYDAARRIREQPWGRSMVLIAQTGWGQGEDRRLAEEAGFNAHIVKPVEPATLIRMLSELP
jgi:CheY-like chemotaxis protein